MSQFYINSENTEDTFDATENLQDAIRIAREWRKGDKPVTRFALNTKARTSGKFVLMPNGTVAEEALA